MLCLDYSKFELDFDLFIDQIFEGEVWEIFEKIGVFFLVIFDFFKDLKYLVYVVGLLFYFRGLYSFMYVVCLWMIW